MASKQIALGTIIKTDQATANTFVAHTLLIDATPPAREREQIDAPGLGDTLDVPELGVESRSMFTFNQYWHPGDTEHEKMDTAFGSKATFSIQIVTPHSTAITDEFDVKITKLTPEVLTRNGLYKRQVEMVRVSAITRT